MRCYILPIWNYESARCQHNVTHMANCSYYCTSNDGKMVVSVSISISCLARSRCTIQYKISKLLNYYTTKRWWWQYHHHNHTIHYSVLFCALLPLATTHRTNNLASIPSNLASQLAASKLIREPSVTFGIIWGRHAERLLLPYVSRVDHHVKSVGWVLG